jgi:plastocyanin
MLLLLAKDVIANDTDVDGDTLSLTAVTTAGTGTVAINSDGVSVDYTPAANFNGTEVITYTVSDGTLTDATGTLTITVNTNNYTINVTASSSANYTLSGTDFNGAVSGNDPNLTFYVGDQITFAVNASNHPFYIKTVAGTGTGNQASNVTNNGTESGNVVWTPTEAGTYYYQCSAHAGMVGTITIASNSNLSGSVNNDTTWALSGSPYTITGNVLVASGVTLTIEAGVTVKVNSGLYIKNEGVIKAVGNSSDKITFQSSADSPAKSDWEGIRIRSTGGSSIDGSQNYSSGSQFKYVVIKHADIGLYIYDAGLHVSNTEFDTNKYGVEIRKTDGVVIDNSIFSGNTNGIWSAYETFSPDDITGHITNTYIKNSTFSNNNNGVDLWINQRDFNNLNIIKNIFNGNNIGIDFGGGGYGPRVHSVLISENIVYNSTSYGVNLGQVYGLGTDTSADYPLELTKNIIVNNAGGALFVGSSSSVKYKIDKNILTNNESDINSILFNHRSPAHIISNNSIISKGKNIYIDGSSSYHPNNLNFTYNLFSNASNNEIIDIKYGSGHVFNNNNLSNPSSTGYFLKNQTANSIDAENNYWGTSAESEIQAAIYDYSDDFELGAVDYTPFSTAPNPTPPISSPSNVTKSVSGSDVVLNWSANGESDVAGYKLYYGTPTGYSYVTVVDLGNVTTYTSN